MEDWVFQTTGILPRVKGLYKDTYSTCTGTSGCIRALETVFHVGVISRGKRSTEKVNYKKTPKYNRRIIKNIKIVLVVQGTSTDIDNLKIQF